MKSKRIGLWGGVRRLQVSGGGVGPLFQGGSEVVRPVDSYQATKASRSPTSCRLQRQLNVSPGLERAQKGLRETGSERFSVTLRKDTQNRCIIMSNQKIIHIACTFKRISLEVD